MKRKNIDHQVHLKINQYQNNKHQKSKINKNSITKEKILY
jgi:hypothetical protein